MNAYTHAQWQALCRTAAQKALPTDEEIAEIGAESAAAFLEQLYTQGVYIGVYLSVYM